MKKIFDNLTIIAMIPLLIGGAIAVMILSYMLVPLMIVGIVFLIAKTLTELDVLNEEREDDSP